MKFVFRNQWGYKTQLRTLTLVVWVQLPLGWNTYLLFNTDIVNFVWKTDERETEIIVLLIFVLWQCLNLCWIGGGGVGLIYLSALWRAMALFLVFDWTNYSHWVKLYYSDCVLLEETFPNLFKGFMEGDFTVK